MRFKAKKQPTVRPDVEELEEGPIKPSCGFFRLWKTLFWKHRPRVDPAVTPTVIESLVARRLPKERVSIPTGIGESGEGDYFVINHHKRLLVVDKIIDKTNVTVEEEVDLLLDRPSTPDLCLSGRAINPRSVDKMTLFKPDSELSAKEISQMLDVESQLKGLLSDVKGLSRRMDNVISDGRQNKTKTRPAAPAQSEFTIYGPPMDRPFGEEDDDDSSVDLSYHCRDSDSDAVSWGSSFSSPEPCGNFKMIGRGAHRAEVLRVWD